MIIGIGGVSNSGKSRLARRLATRFSDRKVKVFHQDQYVFPVEQIPKIRDHPDWEVPESIDFEKLKQEIRDAEAIYDIIIVEGLMVFYDPELRSFFDRLIHLRVSREAFLKRKAGDKRWGLEPEWYREHIWNCYLLFGQLPKNEKNALILSGSAKIDIDGVIHYICSSDGLK